MTRSGGPGLRRRRTGPGAGPGRGPVPLLALALALCSLAALLAPVPALAARSQVSRTADGDLLRLTFSGRPSYTVVRTGPRTLLIPLPPETLRAETLERTAAGDLVSGVRLTDRGVEVDLSTPAFGYLAVPQPVSQGIDIHVFRDPFGDRWAGQSRPAAPPAPGGRPGKAESPPAPSGTKTPAQAPAQTPAPGQKSAPPKAQPPAQAAGAKPGPGAKAEPGKKPTPAANAKDGKAKPPLAETTLADAQPQPPALPPGNATQGPPSGAEPAQTQTMPPAAPPSGVLRAEVRRVGPDQAQPLNGAAAPPASAAVQAPGQPTPGAPGEMRFRADSGATPDGPPAVSLPTVGPARDEQKFSVAAAPPGVPAPANASLAPGAPSPDAPGNATVPGDPAAQGNATEAAPVYEDPLREKFATLFAEAQGEMTSGNLASANTKFKDLLAQRDLPQDMREESLYNRAEVLNAQYRGELKDHFEEIASAYNAAMNANPTSPAIPGALINLGLLNMKVGNLPEARAYFKLLTTNYPKDQNIPYINYYWGDYHFKRGEWEKAAEYFQDMVQNHPENKMVRPAALGLAQCLDQLGNFKQAFQILDYIDKRWPRFYLDEPAFLRMFAEMSNVNEKYEDAKNRYWTFYNLDPNAEGNDVVLAALGDIYLRLDKKSAAKEIYEKTAATYPDKEGGLVAQMRLAEEGIHDRPTMEEMAKVFDRPFTLRPQQIYTQIVRDFPKSPLAPLAQMKLGMWFFWNKRYADTLRAVQDFTTLFPNHALRPRAEELGLRVFNLAVPELVHDENYGRILEFWNAYRPILEKAGVTDDMKMAVAMSHFKKGEVDKALKLAGQYLGAKQDPKFSEMALDMALSAYLDRQAWSDIVNQASLAKANWKLDPKRARQVEYALAMAYENLGDTDKSAPLWERMATDPEMDPAARGYGMYYQAKAALKAHDLRKVFIHSQQALELFLATGGDRDKIKDCILMTIYAAEASGQYREALKWANKYDTYIPETDPEWASSRFRLAKLYQLAGAQAEWEKLMKEIREKKPDTLYGKMAATALDSTDIEKQVREYQDQGVKK